MRDAVNQMYFIAIVLPQHLDEKILPYKKLVLEKFDCKVGLKSPAHITIIPPFWMEDEKEAGLLHDTDNLCSGIHSFQIVTKNFSAFKPRTIFIDVEKNEQLKQVKQAADSFFKQRSLYKMKIENRNFHPHITIATRDLHKKTFYEAWQLFETKEFTEEWMATGMSVLRHNKSNWNVIHTSGFINE
jgi:2'-5' RNA ligase